MAGYPIEVGERFGKLTAVEMTHKVSKSGRKRAHWVCKCDCGGSAVVDSGNLRNGNSTQCWDCRSMAISQNKRTHHHSIGSPNYGKLYYTWQAMRARCNNPNNKAYPRYGGAGVSVCERWDKFENFAEDMGEPPTPDHSIDRVDSAGNYEPDNCRWLHISKQSGNRKSNVVFEYDGKEQTLADHCRDHDLPYHTIKARILRGWAPDEAMSKPIRNLKT